MKLSEAIRVGAKRVARQERHTWFVWDARLPRWQCDRYPPNCACAVGAALLADGYSGPWDRRSAHIAAIQRWEPTLVEYAVRLNDRTRHGFRAIANRVAEEESA